MISVSRSDDVVQNSSAVFETQTLKKSVFHFLSTAAADRHFSSHTPSLSFCHTHTPVYRDQALVLSQADSDVKRDEALNEASCLIVWNVALRVYGERSGL